MYRDQTNQQYTCHKYEMHSKVVQNESEIEMKKENQYDRREC